MLTHLGENVADRAEAQSVAEHYLEVVQRVRTEGLDTEISVKLTQLGLDLSAEDGQAGGMRYNPTIAR